MKKRILMAVIGTFLLIFLGGCGKSENQPMDNQGKGTGNTENNESVSAADPAWKSDKESGKLSWYVNADWWNTDYGNDVITAQMKKDLNLDIEFQAGTNAFGTTAGSWGNILQNLLGTPLLVDGKYYDRNNDPEYQKWLNTFAQIYRKGLISDDVFSDDDNLVSEKLSTGKYFMFTMGGIPQNQVPLQNWYGENPDKQYIAIDGPRDSKKSDPILEQGGLSGWSVTYISKQCKNPKKAIEVYTYLISDYGRMLTSYGIEGEHYTLDSNGMAVVSDEVNKLKNEDPDRYDKELRFDDVWMFMVDSFRVKHGYIQETEAVQQPFEWSAKYLKPRFEMDSIEPKAGTKEYRNLTNINTNFATTILGMVRSSDDEEFNQLWQDFLKYRDSKGWNDIVAIMNENIAKNMKKLGEK